MIPAVATVGFLHVAAAHVHAARRLLAEHAPWIVDVHLVDRLLLDPGEDVLTRVAARVGELAGRDVDAIVCTCPDLVADVARMARELGVSTVAVDEVERLAIGA